MAKKPPLATTRSEPHSSTKTVASAAVVQEFVEHWGAMARGWGINATMGELFALLYITGTDWTADALREHLSVSRGNVSMNLRELMGWGLVHKVHRQGERREYYRAEADVWTLFRRILSERKKRELDPTLQVIDRTARTIASSAALRPLEDRVVALQRFFALVDALACHLLAQGSSDVDQLKQLLGGPPPAGPKAGS